MVEKNLRYRIYSILKWLCILYAIGGLALWAISLIHTDYKSIHIADWMIGDDGSVGYQWNLHDKSWIHFDTYTYPFVILTLPIYMIIISSVNEGKLPFILQDILMLYLVLVPYLLLWLCILLKNYIKKQIKQKGLKLE